MLLYYTNEKKLADRYGNLFTEQIAGYDEFNNIMRNYSLRNSSNVLIKSQSSGITGLVCAFPDDSFINAEQIPPAGPENILFVVKFFGGRVNSLKSKFIKPTNPNSRYVMLGLRFDGMLITSPDEHASFVIPPIQQGTHYDYLPILNGN
ncbi:hypothetical protein, partial [Caldivirga sp. UBA161]|uniref:hypothetical protein n=1 Tax=Caldivirga sp. UBA161 TaxID=1915569 RepID=UPI0025BF66A1